MIPTTAYPTQYNPGAGGAGTTSAGVNQPAGSPVRQAISILQRPAGAPPYQHTQAVGQQNPRVVYTSLEAPPRPEKPVQLKTPLALLNEICSKHNIIPKSEVTEKGQCHSRSYLVSMSIEHEGVKWEGTGKARNMQGAKQEAARNLLINIDARNERLVTDPQKEETTPGTTVAASNYSPDSTTAAAPDLSGNPVGELSELCAKFKFPTPSYTEDNTGNIAGFVINCSVGELVKGTGQASNKKLAKKSASIEALTKLRQLLKSRLEEKLSTDEVNFEELSKLIQVKLNTEDSMAANVTIKFASLDDKLLYFKGCKGPKVDLLTKTNFKELQKCDPADILTQLCEEHKWKTEFVDFAPTEDEPKHRSLVSCTVEGHSLFLLSGLGNSASQARKAAVVELLGMLRHLLRK